MEASLLQPQGRLSAPEAFKLAQLAPTILRRNPKAVSQSPLAALFSAPETADLWTSYENLLFACLRTANDDAAQECISRLVTRFGEENERIMALKGLVQEAQASNHKELEDILKEYDAVLKDTPGNIPLAKRRVALLRSLNRVGDATTNLLYLLAISPTDMEGWAELADLYLEQGLYSQAIFALEEVLVLAPNAWNIHARLGEVQLMASATAEGSARRYLAEALKRFCRSIELCDDYLRGYYGLKKVTDKLLAETGQSKKQMTETDGFSLPDQATIEKLNQAAVNKLSEIVRRFESGDKAWQGYHAGEIAASKEALAQSRAESVR